MSFLRKLVPRRRPVIVVSGLPRSGTSMVMRMLERGGFPIVSDGARAPDEDNPRGYFEDQRVKSLDKPGDKGWVREAEGKALKVVSSLLAELPDGLRYRVIFMRRDLKEVIASQDKMLERRGEPRGDVAPSELERMFRSHLERVERALASDAKFKTLFLDHRAALESPLEAARQIADFVGGDLEIEYMASSVEKGLHRNRA